MINYIAGICAIILGIIWAVALLDVIRIVIERTRHKQ